MRSIYQQIAELEDKNEPVALCTIVRSHGSTPRRAASKMLVFQDGKIQGSVGGGEIERKVITEAIHSLKTGHSVYLDYSLNGPERGDVGICGGQVEVFVEPIIPKPVLVVVGGGHVGKALVHLAHWLGFRVVVSDDRPEFCTPEAIPEADEYYPVPMDRLASQITITNRTYFVLTTRGVDVDVVCLPVLLDSPAAYIGVIGSRRRWSMTRKHLLEKGISDEILDQVHSPIGLELNAETPEEIAVSIMAQIIMHRHGGNGKEMRYIAAKSADERITGDQ